MGIPWGYMLVKLLFFAANWQKKFYLKVRTCYEMIGLIFHSRFFDGFSWILKEQWGTIATEKYEKKNKKDA